MAVNCERNVREAVGETREGRMMLQVVNEFNQMIPICMIARAFCELSAEGKRSQQASYSTVARAEVRIVQLEILTPSYGTERIVSLVCLMRSLGSSKLRSQAQAAFALPCLAIRGRRDGISFLPPFILQVCRHSSIKVVGTLI